MASKAVFNPAISVPFSNLIFMIFQNLRGPSLRSTNGILNHDRNGIDLFGHPQEPSRGSIWELHLHPQGGGAESLIEPKQLRLQSSVCRHRLTPVRKRKAPWTRKRCSPRLILRYEARRSH